MIKVHELNSNCNRATARELKSSNVKGMRVSGIRQFLKLVSLRYRNSNMQVFDLPRPLWQIRTLFQHGRGKMTSAPDYRCKTAKLQRHTTRELQQIFVVVLSRTV